MGDNTELNVVNYNDDAIEIIENDIEAVRKIPTNYIGYKNNIGHVHMIKEIYHNAIDEASVENGICDEIFISYDEATKKTIVADDGRGYPLGKIEQILTILHSSGKYDKEKSGYKFTAGSHGVGGTVVNALSKYFKINTCRDGKRIKMVFEKGVKVSEEEEKANPKESGTTIEFIPDEEIMNELDTKAEEVMDMVEKLAYLTPIGTKVKFHATRIGSDGEINKVFKNKNGLTDYLDIILKDKLMKPIRFKSECDEMEIEIAFTYNPHSTEEHIISFANYCITINEGSHVSGFRDGLNIIMKRKIEDMLTDSERKKIGNILISDVKSGLVAIVDAKHVRPEYQGQAKEKISNKDLYHFTKNATLEFLNKFSKENPKEFGILARYIKDNASVRNESQKIKEAIIKKSTDNTIFSENYPSKLARATGGRDVKKELFLIEGDSAAGAAKKARNPETQALLPFRGVTKNTFDLSIVDALNNNEIKDLIRSLGTNYGKHFRYQDLEYEKIIIMTDADVDGGKIFSILAVFFLMHMVELVKKGHLYKAVPPLYRFKYKGKDVYIKTKKDYVDFIENMISKEMKIAIGKKVLSSDEIKQILFNNRSYISFLNKLSLKLGLDALLLERLIYLKGKSFENIQKELSNDEYFRYLKYMNTKNGLLINGVVNNEFQSIEVNSNFYEKCISVSNIIHNENNGNIFFNVNDEIYTLYQLMCKIEKFEPSEMIYYKGLGEMNWKALAETTMNPETRTLIQLTVEDLEKEVETFRKLHGKSSDERRKLMQMFDIDPEDIDV